jgi:plastocyanin
LRIAWLVRGALAAGVVVLVLAALGSRPAAEQPQPAATAVVSQVEATQPTALSAPPTAFSAPPAATSVPLVERIVSRIARETQAPYPTATTVPDGLSIVSIVDFGYMPSQVRIHVGQTVAWRNDGRESHDVTGDDDWHSGPIEAPVLYRHTFGFAGMFTYRCSVHLDMHGTIVVVP